jgi:CheY-like chemotaxis protein
MPMRGFLTAGVPRAPTISRDLLSGLDGHLDCGVLHSSIHEAGRAEERDTHPSLIDIQPTEAEWVQALIVDSDMETRYYLRAKFSLAGIFRVDEAATGSEALYLLKTRRYRLVLMDLELPDIDGWNLAARVKALRIRTVPAHSLILTGHKLSWLAEFRGRLAGARSCIRKPLDPLELTVLLRTLAGASGFRWDPWQKDALFWGLSPER